ncbi:MAG TPA: hypothetical protein VN922_24635 [Bacteroidia bacterium]|nr:hypothetical protein [Bacteroidia bacterium]
MITKTVQTLTGRIRLNIPTELSEITLGAMIEMESATGNSIPLIPELTEDVVNNITDIADLIDIRERILSLAHKIKYQYQETKLPAKLIGVKVPSNLSIEPAGAYLVCRDLIAEEINKHIELHGEDDWQSHFHPSLNTCALILSNYFYSRVTGELWNEQKAEEFQEQVLTLSVAEALPVARFFIRSYPDLCLPKISLWQVFKQKLREKRALRNLRSSVG